MEENSNDFETRLALLDARVRNLEKRNGLINTMLITHFVIIIGAIFYLGKYVSVLETFDSRMSKMETNIKEYIDNKVDYIDKKVEWESELKKQIHNER